MQIIKLGMTRIATEQFNNKAHVIAIKRMD